MGDVPATTPKQQAKDTRNVDWYHKELDKVPEASQQILVEYSKIPPAKVNEHIIAVRERAWDVNPFPCLGGFRFLDLALYQRPQYAEILRRVQHGEKFLDLGCCIGQELRKLILDGAPSENLYGSDLQPEFFELGYDLFLDRQTCRSTFIPADILHPPKEFSDLDGTISVICSNSFFHLFDRPQQLDIAARLTRVLAPRPGVMILGRQVGGVNPEYHASSTMCGRSFFRHSEQSWRELWEEVGKQTNTRWNVEVDLVGGWGQKRQGDPSEKVQLRFCVRRL